MNATTTAESKENARIRFPKSLLLCSHNEHKAHEFEILLPSTSISVIPSNVALPPEIGSTFIDNARIKATAGHALFPNQWILADDSGLAVDALNGQPGVRSARYAGEKSTDEKNNQKLLRKLRKFNTPTDRTAQFVCVLVMIAPNGDEYISIGNAEGVILFDARGSNGFGYDPIFEVRELKKSFAELSSSEKAEISHRHRAVKQLRNQFQ